MSSLLQFRGVINDKGVGLEFYQTKPRFYDTSTGPKEYPEEIGDAVEQVKCNTCGSFHPRLWVAYRKPKGMFGHWVIFEYNGEEHTLDLSTPIALYKVPRDAEKLSDEENARAWHD